ncbi:MULTISPECIES: hypothetical protein [Flavobacteriaceae]|uniref:hypothetical protein n=1 Tax=Flavobacteriaceae TaxID=49546 RepID=UPI001491223A|nr:MULTISPECIES: hypothetical protein [Allomuricauda]MDC6366103.1 hypothetical protein [Muricauda sp. AC10]
MQVLTIIWTLICAAVIIAYPIVLCHGSTTTIETTKERITMLATNTVELLSFDIQGQLPGWAFSLNVPELTEEVLFNNPILFYLESEDSCLKLPINNESLGYTANVYKNVGKAYITFKSSKDGVSNFYVPAWHLSKLKILIIKSSDKKLFGEQGTLSNKSKIYKGLQRAGVNINNYEEVLEYLSNIALIDFKGHVKPNHSSNINNEPPTFINTKKHELSPVG